MYSFRKHTRFVRAIRCLLFGILAIVLPVQCLDELVKLTWRPHPSYLLRAEGVEELQIPWLARSLNRAVTQAGKKAFQNLMLPVTNYEEIVERQELVRHLVHDPALFNTIEKLLKDIASVEPAVMVYFEDEFSLGKEITDRDIDGLYYTDLLAGKSLNNSPGALEATTGMSIIRSTWSIFAAVAFAGFDTAFFEWFHGRKGVGEALTGSLRGGLKALKRDLSVYTEVYKAGYDGAPTADNTNEKLRSYREGTFADRCISFSGGAAAPLWGTPSKNMPNRSIAEKLLRGAAGIMFSSALSCYHYWILLTGVSSSVASIANILNTTHQLQNHLYKVAVYSKKCRALAEIIEKDSVLHASPIGESISLLFADGKAVGNSEFKQLIQLFDSSTFKAPAKRLFSRGRVLYAHRLMKRVKQRFRAAIYAIAKLDAAIAMARLVGTNKAYNFAMFDTEATNAALLITNGFVPMLHQKTVNSITLGFDGVPNKIVITGPNGCGKSTFLKMVGHVVSMAQSWGVVPAHEGFMSVFDDLITVIHPREDLQNALSSFMAQRRRIQLAEQELLTVDGRKKLFLGDELNSGTPEAMAGELTYELGMRLASKSTIAAAIATHVEKPIFLERDTHGAFANYQVNIKGTSRADFQRTFNIMPGIAEWWFYDAGKRRAFVEWLAEEIEKQEKRVGMIKEMAVLNKDVRKEKV